MSTKETRQTRLWFLQAGSDLRVARAILAGPAPLLDVDAGCHVAAMCAQAVEKSLKAYVILNGGSPDNNHRPDGHLVVLLDRSKKLLKHKHHHPRLCRLFDGPTRSGVRQLLDLTPGGRGSGNNAPNTEYPWKDAGDWRHIPAGDAVFADPAALRQWVDLARRVHENLHKLWVVEDLRTAC